MELSSSKIKNFLIFQELSSSNIKKFLIFSQKKAFLIFPEMELYILRNGNPEKNLYISGTELSYISGSNFPGSKSKKNPLLKSFLYFREMKLSSPKPKKPLLFQEVTCKA